MPPINVGTASIYFRMLHATTSIQRDTILIQEPSLGCVIQQKTLTMVNVGDTDVPVYLGDTSTNKVVFVCIISDHDVLVRQGLNDIGLLLKSNGLFTLFNTEIENLYFDSASTNRANVEVYYGVKELND